jgi:hypothetical protein
MAAMTDAPDRLNRLIVLASDNAPANRRTLAMELCDLLLDWPQHYPPAMREPFEALLEKTVRLIDEQTRRVLIAKLAPHAQTPLLLLNEFYFDAPAETREAIVLRNALLQDHTPPDVAATDEKQVVAAARSKTNGEFTASFAAMLGIETATAKHILQDRTGRALAIACKGAHLARATFSALALLTEAGTAPDETRERLSSFDTVPLTGAERLLDFWRHRPAA